MRAIRWAIAWALAFVGLAALLAGCASTTGRRPDDTLTATCGPPVAQTVPPASSAGGPWRQSAASSTVAARDGAVSVDGRQPQARAYFDTIRERIRSKWVYPRPAGERGIEGELLIEFHIAKDGRLEYIELRRSSGTQILDEAALTAVKLAKPFPQVPESLCKETLAIDGQFRYQIKSGRPFGQISERATSSLLSMGLVGPRR